MLDSRFMPLQAVAPSKSPFIRRVWTILFLTPPGFTMLATVMPILNYRLELVYKSNFVRTSSTWRGTYANTEFRSKTTTLPSLSTPPLSH